MTIDTDAFPYRVLSIRGRAEMDMLGDPLVARLADDGFPRQVELVAAGYLDEMQARIDWSMQHRYLIDP